MAGHNMVGYGSSFHYPRFWDTPQKKRNKDKMTDDKNNDLKSSNMTDKKEFGGNLMEEGVIMWAIFTKEGKAALRMDYEVHPEWKSRLWKVVVP